MPPTAAVLAVHRHPDYDRNSIVNDIALLRLREVVSIDLVGTIPLVDTIPLHELSGPDDGDAAFVTGWGAERTGGQVSNLLKGAAVEVDASCGVWPALDAEWDHRLQLCASAYPDGFCSGDSGGPLVVEENGVRLLAGLVSFNSTAGCAVGAVIPDVYTRISTYAEWVEGVTGPLWSSVTVGGSATSAELTGLQPAGPTPSRFTARTQWAPARARSYRSRLGR